MKDDTQNLIGWKFNNKNCFEANQISFNIRFFAFDDIMEKVYNIVSFLFKD
jgi:hypothetical protein